MEQPPLSSSLERDIPLNKITRLESVIGDTVEGLEDYALIEDLVSSAIFSQIEIRKTNAKLALDKFLGTSVQIFTMTTKHEISAYITLNGIDSVFFFVNYYPNIPVENEVDPAQAELDAFWRLNGFTDEDI